MYFSIFVHGTSLRIESPDEIAGSDVLGWGTVLYFKEPVPAEGVPAGMEGDVRSLFSA
jgi:hypothetical protein